MRWDISVVGPDNCIKPGTTQWLAVPFIAAASGIPKQVSASIIVADPRHCPTREVTLSIYTDACYPVGPGTPLVSGVATKLPRATCNMGVTRLTNAPTLTRGEKYWVVATTNADQSGLDANWYGSNNAQYAHQHRDWVDQSNGSDAGFSYKPKRRCKARANRNLPLRGLEAIFSTTPAQGATTTRMIAEFDVRWA